MDITNNQKEKITMTIIFAIVAIIAILFGICQIMGGYAIGSGFAAIVFGVIVALQGSLGVIEVIPMI